MANNRVIKHIKLNEETGDLIIQFRGHSNAIEAKALEFAKDAEGDIVYLLLDRLIHKVSEALFDCCLNDAWQNGFSVAGCYVTELDRRAVSA